MILYLLPGAILLLIAGITLAGNPLEVSGQSALDEAQDTLGTTANTTANATGELMSRADNVLSLASEARSNATQTAMNKTMNLLSNLSNNITNEVLNTSSNLTEPINVTQEGLKKYENATLGISFQYPSNWTQQDKSSCAVKGCHSFIITVPKLHAITNLTLSSNPIVCGSSDTRDTFEVFIQTMEKCDQYKMIVSVYDLEKPTSSEKETCNCNTLKDFVAWDYDRSGLDKDTFINDNQTTIGNNYSAWQMDSLSSSNVSSPGDKNFMVWAINDNLGYRFFYKAPSDHRFDRHLDGFKSTLESVTFTPATPEKKPSFLSETQNSSILSSAPKVKDEPIKIASSNDFIDSIGYLHVVGEVENNTPMNIQFVKVTGTFYDSNNQVVATDFTYTNPSDIGPGGKAPFDLTLLSASIPVSQIDHYNLIASYQ